MIYVEGYPRSLFFFVFFGVPFCSLVHILAGPSCEKNFSSYSLVYVENWYVSVLFPVNFVFLIIFVKLLILFRSLICLRSKYRCKVISLSGRVKKIAGREGACEGHVLFQWKLGVLIWDLLDPVWWVVFFHRLEVYVGLRSFLEGVWVVEILCLLWFCLFTCLPYMLVIYGIIYVDVL